MLNYLDLFAGAGGLSEGFIQAGYSPVAHVEMDYAACNTLKTRAAFHWLCRQGKQNLYDSYLAGKISRTEFYRNIPDNILRTVLNYEISENTIPEIFQKIDELLKGNQLDLIIGGPPCQAYSIVGRVKSSNHMVGDHRNYLYRLYARFLERYRPRYFVFENVVGLLSAKESDGCRHLDNMRTLFRECGYCTELRILSANHYGVLQNRKRVIMIGRRGDSERGIYPDIPEIPTNNLTVSEIFKDLPFLHAGEGTYGPIKTLHYEGHYLYDAKIKSLDQEEVTFHIARPHTAQDLHIYKLVVQAWNAGHVRLSYTDLPDNLRTHHNIHSFLDRFKVVAADLPSSQTVVAHISRDGHYYIHPDINQNRSLTPRETARLQTFPDNYYFESKGEQPGRTAAYKQIGNAVPVRLAYNIAKALLPLLKG